MAKCPCLWTTYEIQAIRAARSGRKLPENYNDFMSLLQLLTRKPFRVFSSVFNEYCG